VSIVQYLHAAENRRTLSEKHITGSILEQTFEVIFDTYFEVSLEMPAARLQTLRKNRQE
jgi:hypothetical protein